MDFSLVAWNLTVFAISNQDEVEVNGVTRWAQVEMNECGRF